MIKRCIKVNPIARIAHIPKEIIDQGLSGDCDAYSGAVTLTLVPPNCSLDDVESSLTMVLKEVKSMREIQTQSNNTNGK